MKPERVQRYEGGSCPGAENGSVSAISKALQPLPLPHQLALPLTEGKHKHIRSIESVKPPARSFGRVVSVSGRMLVTVLKERRRNTHGVDCR